jgi:hypothetical protein
VTGRRLAIVGVAVAVLFVVSVAGLSERVRPGSIILLHVWYPSRATSLGAVGPLVDRLHVRGYQVGPVRDLLAQDTVHARRIS